MYREIRQDSGFFRCGMWSEEFGRWIPGSTVTGIGEQFDHCPNCRITIDRADEECPGCHAHPVDPAGRAPELEV